MKNFIFNKKLLSFIISLSLVMGSVPLYARTFFLAPAGETELELFRNQPINEGKKPDTHTANGTFEHDDLCERIICSFENLPGWNLSNLLEVPSPEIVPSQASKAITYVFADPFNGFLSSILESLFERQIKRSEIEKIQVDKIQEGSISIVFRVDALLKGGDKETFALNMSRFADEMIAIAMMKEFNYLTKDWGVYPDAFPRPLARTGFRDPAGHVVAFTAYEFIEDIEEVNLRNWEGEMKLVWNKRCKPLELKDELQWIEDAAFIRTISYDENDESMPVFSLAAGDINKRTKDAGNKISCIAISEKVRIFGVKPSQFIQYLFDSYEYSTDAYFFKGDKQGVTDFIRKSLRTRPIKDEEKPSITLSPLNNLVTFIQFARNARMNLGAESDEQLYFLRFDDKGGTYIFSDVDPDKAEFVLMAQHVPPYDSDKLTAYIKGIIKGLYYKYGNAWFAKYKLWIKNARKKEEVDLLIKSVPIFFYELAREDRLIIPEKKPDEEYPVHITMIGDFKGMKIFAGYDGSDFSIGEAKQLIIGRVQSRFGNKISISEPEVYINGILQKSLEKFGDYRPASGDVIYYDFVSRDTANKPKTKANKFKNFLAHVKRTLLCSN